jgi:lysophospholipase L1-like esterase
VALGSSFAAGPGLPGDYDLGCDRSSGDYPHRVAIKLRLALTDVTCSAATTANITTTPQVTATGVRRVQIDAVGSATKLITVTVGGNDVDYTGPGGAGSLWAYGCTDTDQVPPAGAWTAIACGHAVDQAEIEQKLRAEPRLLTDLLRKIHARAPKAELVLVTYQRIIPASGAPCPAIALTAEHARFERDVGQRLEVAFHRAAARSNAELVDTYAAGIHHTACATTEPWVSPWTWGPFPTGTIAFHPTIAGMAAAANSIIARLTASDERHAAER